MDDKNTRFYTNLEEIPIYNFYNCYKGNLNYIFLSKKGEVTKDIEAVWDDMLNKYHEITATYENINFYNLVLQVKWLENRLIYAPILLNLASKTPEKERENLFKELRGWKLPIKTLKDVEKCLTILNNSKNKINRKLDEIEEHRNKNEKLKSTEISLQKQAIRINRNLGVKPNIFEDSVITWISYFQEIEDLSKKNNG